MVMRMRDFTMEKYKKLCLALLDSGYAPLTVESYLTGKQHNSKFIVLRHDIDRKCGNALRMAELEHELGIQSTYYSRFPYTFKPDIIGKIHDFFSDTGRSWNWENKKRDFMVDTS
ncbi:hypothetical protein C5S29_03455 [ANME-1 cluster archaeon GoMg3.2]|nr:hypothetical protein [ANME-1 cluster archaeon GoMg3.2]